MKIAIVHYHLRGGGVTRVIELACQALRGSGVQIAVLAGDVPANSPIPDLAPTACLPELDYGRSSARAGKDLQNDLGTTARRLLGGPPDIWHIHNHSLGKNLALPVAIDSWARSGEAMLLQIHDFAENQRPGNYLGLLQACGESHLNRLLYPCTARIGYALLNSRDEYILRTIDFPGKLFRLPNPAIPLAASSDRTSLADAETESLVVYPCRAIRRKNIGEALLLACAFPKGRHLAIALPPTSPEDLTLYEQWKKLAVSCHLPVQFEACSQQNILLGDLVADAEYLITTSVEEGFGMIFLEAWLANKPLIGRDLPAITTDFRSEGLDLGSLYDFFGIPISLIGKTKVAQSLLKQLEMRFAIFGMPLDERSRDRLFHRAVRGDRVDFGQLEPDLQQSLVRQASESHLIAQEIALPPIPEPKIVEMNRQIVENQYSLARYRKRLLGAYEELISSTAASPVTYGESRAILGRFLTL